MNLSGKKILITGGSTGIGKAAAIFCAQKGATVAIIDKNIRRILSYGYFFRLVHFFYKSNYTVIHTHIHVNIISQILATIITRKKIIWTIHESIK